MNFVSQSIPFAFILYHNKDQKQLGVASDLGYLQKICLPIVFTCGRVQIHLDVAVSGLK